MRQSFAEPTIIANAADVAAWRSQWMAALKSWHSPYKALIDCSQLRISEPPSPEVIKALQTMLKFFEGLFLRQAAGHGLDEKMGHAHLPFSVFATDDEAQGHIGIRSTREKGAPADFRESIQIQNHFQQHVVELNFSVPVVIDDKSKIDALKSKLTNNLMQWHSKWSLMVDCANLEIDEGQKEQFNLLVRYLRGFYMKDIIGYMPKVPKEKYPFEVFRARHNAAARFESEGNFSGEDADCKSRKA